MEVGQVKIIYKVWQRKNILEYIWLDYVQYYILRRGYSEPKKYVAILFREGKEYKFTADYSDTRNTILSYPELPTIIYRFTLERII